MSPMSPLSPCPHLTADRTAGADGTQARAGAPPPPPGHSGGCGDIVLGPASEL